MIWYPTQWHLRQQAIAWIVLKLIFQIIWEKWSIICHSIWQTNCFQYKVFSLPTPVNYPLHLIHHFLSVNILITFTSTQIGPVKHMHLWLAASFKIVYSVKSVVGVYSATIWCLLPRNHRTTFMSQFNKMFSMLWSVMLPPSWQGSFCVAQPMRDDVTM